MDDTSKQYYTFTVGNIGFFDCKCIPLLCAMPLAYSKDWCTNVWVSWTWPTVWSFLMMWSSFQRWKRNTYIDCALFLNASGNTTWSTKPTKYEFFENKIKYLAHHVSKEGVWPSKEDLIAVTRFAPPQTYTEIQAFLGLVGLYWKFNKGFACMQPLHEYLSRVGASKKNKKPTLMEDTLEAFETLKWACLEAPVLAFANFNKVFCLETDARKLGL